MRLLTLCNSCQRQYDASDLKPGSRFRCHCGNVVKVEISVGHDASIVRCSSCGAPREIDSTTCDHCSSQFTLHERDLQTVCPHCAARISDKAKFCHHCGQGIATTVIAGTKLDLNCPACDDKPELSSRRLGRQKVAAAECQKCAGLWLGTACFDVLIAHANDQSRALCDVAQIQSSVVSQQIPGNDKTGNAQGKWRYRDCPQCKKMMQRRHYAKRSGVIIDSCRDHGVWFDADELHKILIHVRTTGLSTQKTQPVSRESSRSKAVLHAGGSERKREHGGMLGNLADALTGEATFSVWDFAIGSLFDL